VAECANGFEGRQSGYRIPADVLFLDVQMPEAGRIRGSRTIDPGVAVVFVTAFDQYAMRAFEAAAVELSAEAVRHRTIPRISGPSQAPGAGPVRRGERGTPQCGRAFRASSTGASWSATGRKCMSSPRVNWDFAEAQDDYVALHSEHKTWLKQQTIASLEAALDPARFLRAPSGLIWSISKRSRAWNRTRKTPGSPS